jgi:hypothetical protein
MPDTRHAATRRRDHDRQRHREHDLSAQLLDAADRVPDDLRADVAVAVIVMHRLNSVMACAIESIAFSVAAQRRGRRRNPSRGLSRYGESGGE